MKFIIDSIDTKSQARAGIMKTSRGDIPTPIFMPVGTLGTVKGVHQRELYDDIKAKIILANTYHMYLRPGLEVIESAGGIHKFMAWPYPMLTDSGGYQVYSLSTKRKITEDGVTFSSHVDGSSHLFTPEKAIDIQRAIGADIIMAFDECTPYPCEYDYAKQSMNLTHRWLSRCIDHFNQTDAKYNHPQTLSGIVQGSTYPDLRKKSAEIVASQNMAINAIGGLSVGEPHEDMYAMTDVVTQILPRDSPRYLMGVGLPENILECISLGIDMFDCVLPTRNARHGLLYTSQGVIHIKNQKWSKEFTPIDANLDVWSSQQYSKAYLRHLFHTKELLAAQIASIHNLSFFIWLVKTARAKIIEGTFATWKETMIKNVRVKL